MNWSEDEQLIPDGPWRLVCLPHARIVDTRTGAAVLDLAGTPWHCEGRVNPCANQLWLLVRDATEAPYLYLFIDLDCRLWWETHPDGRFVEHGRLAAPLAELQQQLSRMELPRRGTDSAVPAAPLCAVPEPRSLTSFDQHYRVELEPSGEFELAANGTRRPLFHALVRLHHRGTRIVDTRHGSYRASLLDAEAMTIELARPSPASDDELIIIDAMHGTCWSEHVVRGPMSSELPLSRLAELL